MNPITPQPEQFLSSDQKHFLNKKFIVTFVVLALLGSSAYAGIWYWQNQQVAEVVPTFTPRASITVTPDPITANWPIFNSKLLNFSFKYPIVANYQERDVFEGSVITRTGKDVYFTDKNSQSPAFSVITNDFSVNDSIPHDIVQGTLSTGNFTLNIFDEKYQKKREVAPGIYEVVGYGNMECSPFMGAFLIVSPPKGSNFKYESFNLYNTPSIGQFNQGDMDSNSSDPYCTPKESAINSKIDYLFNQKDPVLERSLNTAIEIASTFQVSNQTADTSTWKTYTNTQYGFEIKYPADKVVIGSDQVGDYSGVYFRIKDWERIEMGKIPLFIFYFDPKLKGPITATGIKAAIKATSVEIIDSKYRLGSTESIKAQAMFVSGDMTTSDTLIIVSQKLGSLVFMYDYIGNIPVDQILSTFKFTDSADTSTWKLFNSKYFTLSFKVPNGYLVCDSQNGISVFSKNIECGTEQGINTKIFDIIRFVEPFTKIVAEQNIGYTNVREYTTTVDRVSFKTIEGISSGQDNPCKSKGIRVIFDASVLFMTQYPNCDTSTDHLVIGGQILSTFKFTK